MQSDSKNQTAKEPKIFQEVRKIIKEVLKAERTTTGRVNTIVATGIFVYGMFRGDLIYILLVVVGSAILADYVRRNK